MALPRIHVAGLVATLALAFAAPASADPYAFGKRTLEIPAPPGYVAVGKDVPGYMAFSQAYLPETNRLVEVFVPPASKAALLAGTQQRIPRYFQVQVLRSLDGTPLSAGDFAAGMDEVEEGLNAQMATLDEKAAELSEQGNDAMGGQTKTELAIGGTQFHGITRREPWGLFFTASLQVTIEQGGRTEVVRLYGGNAIVLVNHQLLYLYSYADAADADARAVAEASASAWADAIRAANPDDASVATMAVPMTANRRTGSGLVRGALMGASIAVAILLVGWLLSRRHPR